MSHTCFVAGASRSMPIVRPIISVAMFVTSESPIVYQIRISLTGTGPLV